MGYFDSKEELLDRLDSHYSNCQSKYYSSITAQSNAYVHYLAAELWDCIYDILIALGRTNDAVGFLAYQSSGCLRDADILHFLDYFSGGEVTWQAICEAWVKDDFEARFWTIGVIDRMRQIMWDEPFDLTWAARPEQKEIPSE